MIGQPQNIDQGVGSSTSAVNDKRMHKIRGTYEVKALPEACKASELICDCIGSEMVGIHASGEAIEVTFPPSAWTAHASRPFVGVFSMACLVG